MKQNEDMCCMSLWYCTGHARKVKQTNKLNDMTLIRHRRFFLISENILNTVEEIFEQIQVLRNIPRFIASSSIVVIGCTSHFIRCM
mmetsp:Transcript_10443/g.15787  ORF Transcript_10443/g.15787 Transcript_10443/m.15787 type:complete len:86 (-) Transcript_10443:124-381(-)